MARALRALPGVTFEPHPEALFARAEIHGVAGVLWDAWRAAGVDVPDALRSRLDAVALARELDHEAHLALLAELDAALAADGVSAIALKGPLFARRYYAHPSARGTSDVDLLVDETRLEAALALLARIGYELVDSPHAVERFRREHHHLHLQRSGAPDLELHFQAHRGFGGTLGADALVARSASATGFHALRVASAEDELVYLVVHAASHRFGRLGWLYDLKLVVERISDDQIARAARRASEWRFARVAALAAALLVDVLGVSEERVAPFGELDAVRAQLAFAIVGEPRAALLRSATRFAYTTMLADSVAASLRYARTSSFAHARRLLGLDR